MSEFNFKSKRMKMDEYNERRRNSRKKKNPYPGTRGFGACSSNALLSNCNGSELEKLCVKKRKRPPKSCSGGTLGSNDDPRKVYVKDNANSSSSSFQEYMEYVNQPVVLHNVIESVLDEKDYTTILKKSWKERVEATECAWKEAFKTLIDDVFAMQAFHFLPCKKCGSQLTSYVVRCSSCNMFYCGKCDLLHHESQPFHNRTLDTLTSSTCLLSHQFADENGELFSKDVPVPCFPPEMCTSCEYKGHFEILADDKRIAVVTKDGRFDLKSTKFRCKNCKIETKSSIINYITSGFWPGDPQNMSYLISADLLRFWYLTKHNMPGTSMNKFIETLETLFDGQKPSRPINKTHFQNASRYYENFMHQVDVKVKFKDKTVCLSCKGMMLASHCDGNFKLYRLLSALGINLSSLYGDVVIAFDEDMKNHMAKIDSKVPKSKSSETCGDSIFKAARSDAGKFQKLDETGIMMRSCRHGIVDKAVNMHHGETFRHTHFMHLDLPEKACTFLCGDVICRYWDWAKKVASLFPEYKPMIEGMKPFLGRMHAKVHVWYCQIIWVGHWMSEAALTLGEEQEQVFSKMSRYGNVTKHMGTANRRDHLTAAVLFWNDQKEKGMINQLIKRRERALKQIEISNKQLESDILKYKFKIEELPVLLDELRNTARECKAGKENLKDESPLQQAQNSLEGYNAHIKILQSRISRIATTSGQRIKFRKAITLMSKKRSKLIAFISANSEFKIQEENLLTGHFPWQNFSGSQCRSKMTFHEKYQVVDNWMMLLRSREEVLQSENEMRNYVKSLLEHTTLLEYQIKPNDIYLSSTSTSKEIKIAHQKNVIWSQEKEKLHQLLVSAVSKFKEVSENFIEETNTAFLSNAPNYDVNSKEENEVDYFTDDNTFDEEAEDFEETDILNSSDEENSTDEDIFY